MNYDLKKPCSNCPFLKVGGVRLDRRRAKQIARNATDWNGGTFACHKTTNHSAAETVVTDDSQHCAGALIYMLKQDAMNQMSRIAGRLGMLRPDELMADEAVVASVLDSERQMLREQFT